MKEQVSETQLLLEQELKIIIQNEILPCNCDMHNLNNEKELEDANSETYTENDLNGKLFKISCSSCNNELTTSNNTDDLIREWNNDLLTTDRYKDKKYNFATAFISEKAQEVAQ